MSDLLNGMTPKAQQTSTSSLLFEVALTAAVLAGVAMVATLLGGALVRGYGAVLDAFASR